MVTITVIYDNNPWDRRMRVGWGFSCLIEINEARFLFDTGDDPFTLIENMKILKETAEGINSIMLSHPHADHTGGLSAILGRKKGGKLFLGRSFPESFKEWARREGADVVEIYEGIKICKNFYTTGELGHMLKEQSLVVKTERGLTVITGCAHPGIVNILKRIRERFEEKIYLVLGGFHLGDVDVSKDFRGLGVEKVAPCHCTGKRAMAFLESEYGDNFIHSGVGRVVEI